MTVMWRGIQGHDDVAEHFRRTLAARRLATTYLFLGPEGVGKRAFALQLAKVLLCPAADEVALAPCDRCQSCVMCDAGSHPDLHLVERRPGKKVLQIDQFVGSEDNRHREGLCHDIAL